MNTHPLTGAKLQQPDPEPLRVLAVFDPDQPCREHSPAYSGRIPCTGSMRCMICLTEWDDNGVAIPQRAARREPLRAPETGRGTEQ